MDYLHTATLLALTGLRYAPLNGLDIGVPLDADKMPFRMSIAMNDNHCPKEPERA